jgi:hypothetical protein
MYSIYGSIVGVCNIIFTVAMVLLTVRFWVEANVLIKLLLIFGMSLFTVIQPLLVYSRAKKQVGSSPSDVEISFADEGVYVKSNKQTSHLKWHQIKSVLKKPTILVVVDNSKHGFILNNAVLGERKEVLYQYLISRVKNK